MKKNYHLIVYLFLWLASPLLHAQIQRIEPLNWWVGMKNNQLQLMVYGKDVGNLTPEIHYTGVSIQKVTSGDSKNYLFIDLVLSAQTPAGEMNIAFKQNKKTVYTSHYSLLNREKKATDLVGFDAGDVIYLITPDRFANGDTQNDIIHSMQENEINRSFEGARHGGDLRGMIDHIDYIKEMGYTAIWTQPMLQNDMKAYSYHGYAITDYYQVDQRFGTMETYKMLAKKAAQSGIKLIFDDVINHIGSNHPWMKDLPFHDWINLVDSPMMTNHQRTVNQDIYASDYDKKRMNKGWFVPSMPDMNGSNPFVATYLIQHSIWWIESLHLSGIRQDTYGYSDKQLLSQWSCRVMNEYPYFNIVGEEWSYNPLITSYWQQGNVNQEGYQSCLPTVMDFPLQSALMAALTDTNASKGATKLYEALANDFVYAHPLNIMIFGDNHDMDRLYTQLGGKPDLMKMAMAYILTMRGIPQIYYGTEVLMENHAHLGNHGWIRSDMKGGWAEDTVNAFTAKGLSSVELDFQNYMKRLLHWRKSHAELFRLGNTKHFAPFDGVYVYFRYLPSQKIMVVMNNNRSQVSLPIDERFEEILPKAKPYTLRSVLDGNRYTQESTITIAPKSVSIFELSE